MSIKRIMATLLGTTLVAGPAFAADLPQRSAPPMFTPVSAYNWTGLYVEMPLRGLRLGPSKPARLDRAPVQPKQQFQPQRRTARRHDRWSSPSRTRGARNRGGQRLGQHRWIGNREYHSASRHIASPAFRERVRFLPPGRRVGYALDNWLLYSTFGVAAFEGASRGTVLSGAVACGSLSLPNCANSQFRPRCRCWPGRGIWVYAKLERKG